MFSRLATARVAQVDVFVQAGSGRHAGGPVCLGISVVNESLQFGVYVSMQFPEILFAPAFFLQSRRRRIHLAFPEARWCYTFFRATGNLSATLERQVVVRLLWPDVHHRRAVGFGPPQDQACHRNSVENGCRGVARWGCVGECRLWPRNVSEAGVAPARGPRDLRRKNRKLWRPTDAKIMCEQSAVPSSSDIFIADLVSTFAPKIGLTKCLKVH